MDHGHTCEAITETKAPLRTVRQEVRRELLAEAKKHRAWKRLCQIPSIGPIRAAVLLGILQTPHRFRTNRQLWSYSGFGIETHSSARKARGRASSGTASETWLFF
jgi:transposase